MVQTPLVFNAGWHSSKVGIICFVVGDSSLSVGLSELELNEFVEFLEL